MTDPRAEPTSSPIPPIRLAILALALTTAGIHLILGIQAEIVAFVMNALGYIALATTLVLPAFARYRDRIRWLLMGFTVLTIVLWLIFGQPYTTIGYVDKAVELALLGLLWFDMRRASREP